jgi:hypothetical protein
MQSRSGQSLGSGRPVALLVLLLLLSLSRDGVSRERKQQLLFCIPLVPFSTLLLCF